MQIHAYRRTETATVSLFGLNYVFAPNPAGHVVCDVEDERATERLLQIPEAYREYDATLPAVALSPAPAPAPVAAPVAPPVPPSLEDGEPADEEKDEREDDVDAVLAGSDTLPADFTVGEQTYTQAQVIELAFARSGMDREQWNLNDADDREALIEGEVTKLVLAEEKRVADEAAAAEGAGQAPAAEVDPLIITNGAESIDLGTYSAPKLREFAEANGIDLPKGNSVKVGELRLMVAKALTGA